MLFLSAPIAPDIVIKNAKYRFIPSAILKTTFSDLYTAMKVIIVNTNNFNP